MGERQRASQQHVGRLSKERSRLCARTISFYVFFFLPERNIPGGNGQLWNGYTSDEVPQGEQSVWILKNSEYAVFFVFVFFLLSCGGVRSSPQRIFALKIGKRRQARDTLLRQPLYALDR